jgi:hypothetical protein
VEGVTNCVNILNRRVAYHVNNIKRGLIDGRCTNNIHHTTGCCLGVKANKSYNISE